MEAQASASGYRIGPSVGASFVARALAVSGDGAVKDR